jgi:hypothetical protein
VELRVPGDVARLNLSRTSSSLAAALSAFDRFVHLYLLVAFSHATFDFPSPTKLGNAARIASATLDGNRCRSGAGSSGLQRIQAARR